MQIKEKLSLPFARFIQKRTKSWAKKPHESQRKVFQQLIQKAKNTEFGRDHHFENIHSYNDFKKQVPIYDYEGLKPYVERIKAGEKDVLWPGKPIYLSKTSGTTSGAKYIPITKASMPFHIEAARDAILHYIAETKKTGIVNGKMIFLQGSPELDNSGPIPIGRLSGIVANHVPAYLQKNRLPSFTVNCIEDWEQKVNAICEETKNEDLRLISGIPPWVQMYFEQLIAGTRKPNIKDIFPNFSLFIYGGVNYAPYKENMERLIGKKVDSIELYPASEGFIAYQDCQEEKGMLLLLNSGIFYEFIPADEFFESDPTRLSIEQVELGKNYVLILNTNAGLWGYNIGDTIKFVSIDPYRIIVSGRIKHYTSAFGEHVIAEEVEKAIQIAMKECNVLVKEFHLAPQVNPPEGELPYHEWLIEFGQNPDQIQEFSACLNQNMVSLNPYYKDLIEGNIIQALKVTTLPSGAFQNYMKSQGKLGGQNKVPRLMNDRKIADLLIKPFD